MQAYSIHPNRRALLLASFPSLAIGLLNTFWMEPLYRLGVGWFYLADLTQWILVPCLVWFFILRPASIRPRDFGLDFSHWRAAPGRTALWFSACALILWLTYTQTMHYADLHLAQYGGNFGYPDAMPASYAGQALVAVYYAATAAVVEEVVFRGLPWAYCTLTLPQSQRAFWYVVLTALLFAATHSEQGLHGMLPALAYGLAAALLYARLQNLWPLMFGHFAVDLISFWP